METNKVKRPYICDMKNVSYENISKNQSYDLFLKQGI